MAYPKPRKRDEMLRGKGDKIMFIDFRFERWQVVGFWKRKGMQDVPCIASFYGQKMLCGMEDRR